MRAPAGMTAPGEGEEGEGRGGGGEEGEEGRGEKGEEVKTLLIWGHYSLFLLRGGAACP